MRKSIAAARMWRPSRRALEQEDEEQQADARNDDRDDRDLADVDVADRDGTIQVAERRCGLAERAEGEQRDALQQECDREGRDEHHRGRLRAQRPEDDEVHQERQRDDDAEAERDPDDERQIPLRRECERVGAGHDELAVREVDEPQDAEDETDPDRHERVDGAEPDRVDDHLPADAEKPERHERYAATILAVSFASAGVSVSRSSPFAIT